MNRLMVSCMAATIGVALLLISPALSQQKAPARSPDDIVASVPLEVPEVISGGGWQDAGKTGIYRGLVVLALENGQPVARVFVQWIGIKSDGGAPEIVRSLAIRDVSDKKLANAMLSVEADADNEATFIVTTVDTKSQQQSSFAYKATKPGQIASAPLPQAYAPSTKQ